MSDARRRLLERLAGQDDPAARARSQVELARAGLLERSYVLVPEGRVVPSYAEGVHLLRKACERERYSPHPAGVVGGVARFVPLTFEGNVEAFLNHYDQTVGRPIEEHILTEMTRLESATGIAFKAGTTLFKIVPYCQQLTEIPRYSQNGFLPCDYDNIEGDQLDSSAGVYYDRLTLPQALAHHAWEKAIPNKEIRERFMRIAFEQFPRRRPDNEPDKGMGFFVHQKPKTDELRALWLGGAYDSYASGYYVAPGEYTRFVRVCTR